MIVIILISMFILQTYPESTPWMDSPNFRLSVSGNCACIRSNLCNAASFWMQTQVDVAFDMHCGTHTHTMVVVTPGVKIIGECVREGPAGRSRRDPLTIPVHGPPFWRRSVSAKFLWEAFWPCP